MSLGVLGEYGKILLAFSPYAIKYFLLIFQTSSYSSCTLEYFLHILRICRKNGEYTERNFYFQQRLTKLKRKSNSYHKLAYDEQMTNFIFWLSLTFKVFSVYTAKRLNSEKNLKS
jgi:hypothetical protein